MKERLCPRTMALGLIGVLAIATLAGVGCGDDDTTGSPGGVGYGSTGTSGGTSGVGTSGASSTSGMSGVPSGS